MSQSNPIRLLMLLVAITSSLSNLHADQPPLQGGEFRVIKGTIDSGGAEADGGVFELRGTIGQHDAGGRKNGGEYELRSGFWTDPAKFSEAVFIDSFE